MGLWLPLSMKQICFPYPGFCHQHVVPQDGGPTTWELADVGDHHDRQRGSLKVNDQTRLAQLGFKTKGVKLFSNDERALKKTKRRGKIIGIH